MYKIGDISEMRTGIIVSSFKNYNYGPNHSDYKILTLASIDEYNHIVHKKLDSLKFEYEKIEACLTRKGDILIRQSYPFTVIVIDDEINLVVPSTFIILRMTNNLFNNDFVGWYLGTYKVRNDFIRTQTGSIQPTINKKIISDIVLPNLNINDQRKISQLISIMTKRSKKVNKLLDEYEKENEVITKLLIEKNIESMERN